MKWKNIGIFFLVACLCLGTLTGCFWSKDDPTKGTEDVGTTGDADTTETEGDGTKAESLTYTIQVKTDGGMAMSGIGVYVYETKACDELVWFEKTDEAGQMTFDAPEMDGYVAVLVDVPEGYLVDEMYEVTGEKTEIVLSAELAEDVDLSEMSFDLGDVICDVTMKDVNGKEHKLSEILKEKKAVMLNFWYLDCTPCKMEFPHLQDAYEKYADKVEVLAMNPIDTDEAKIKAFAEEQGLTFPIGACEADWQKAMGIMGYPTTVMIDQYGVISLVHAGAMTSSENFEDIFAHFTADDYKQGVVENVKDLLVTPADPEDEVINNPTEVSGVSSFELTVKPGETVYCDLYRMTNRYMQVKSNNASLKYMGRTYNPKNGVIGLTVNTPDMRTPVEIALTNTGDKTETFKFTLGALAGTLDNPYTMTLGTFNASVSAGNEEGVYYRYVAEKDGYLAVRCTSATAGVPYNYILYNLSTYANRTLESDAVLDADGNKIVEIKVSKGQTVQFSAGSLSDDSGNYPAANFTFVAYMADESAGGEEDDVEKKVYAITITDEKRNPIKGVPVEFTGGEDVKESVISNSKGIAGVKLVPGEYVATVKVPVGYTAKTTEFKLTEANATVAMKMDTVVTETAVYTVKIVDADGAPIANVPVTVGSAAMDTDASGLAVFELVKGDYTAVIGVPDGYTADTLAYEFAGETELTIVLKKGTGEVVPDPNKAAYTVKITDYSGNALQGAAVTFFKNGNPVGVKNTGADGAAEMQLEKGAYTISVAFRGNYYCDATSVILTETNASVTLKAAMKRGSDYKDTYMGAAYYLNVGATYVDGMQANTDNLFVFVPEEGGVYRFTTTDPAAQISYWGASDAYIANQTGTTDYANNAFTREVREGQAGQVMFLIGVTGKESCVIEITRTGDVILTDEEKAEWIVFEGTQTPAAGTIYRPAESGNLVYVDVLNGSTAANTPVKGSDGYYHLGSASGPILYVNLGPNGYKYINFYQMTGHEQAGGTNFQRVFYDEDGKFVKKEEYTPCFKAYVDAIDPNGLGIYPLTEDLMYMLQNGGAGKHWYDGSDINNCLFKKWVDDEAVLIPFNEEIAWMFNCCYFE